MATDKKLSNPALKPFRQQGYYPTGTSGDRQVYGNCIFCGKKDKFYVNTEKKTWDCKVCNKSGGFQSWLREVLDWSRAHFKGDPAQALSKARSLSLKTLERAQIGYNPATRTYILPVKDITGQKIWDLRIYKNKKLLSTASCKTGLYGWHKLDGTQVNIWLCEGEWDALAMEEALKNLNRNGEAVVAVPGANTFKQEWVSLFRDMNVNVLYDNDKAGRDGSIKVYNYVKPVSRNIAFLHWSEKEKPGKDLRDLYMQLKGNSNKLFKRLRIALKDTPQGADDSQIHINSIASNIFKYEGKGHTAEEVYKGYSKWLKLNDRNVIDILYATFLANRLAGDPVWLFLVAVSGGTKSELIMSFDDVQNVTAISGLTPRTLISGATFAGGGDPSLIPRLNERMLLIKDFTNILNMNPVARDEILGQFRDAYDGKCAKPLGNGVFREYISKFGVLAGVTPALEILMHGQSAVGERFLNYYAVEPQGINAEKTVIRKALDNTTHEDEMRADLRQLATETLLYDYKNIPIMGDDIRERVLALAQWTAIMRGTIHRDRYTKEITHKPFREMGTRLAKQFSKLVTCTGMFRRLDTLTDAEYDVVKWTAVSSVPTKMREFIKLLYTQGRGRSWGLQELIQRIRLPQVTVERTAEDLRMLGALDKVALNKIKKEWVLSETMVTLMEKARLYK